MTFPGGGQGQNPDAGLPPRSVSNIPVPDPSKLTTEQLDKEIEHLRELIEARLAQVEKTAEATRIASERAVEKALEAADKAVKALENNFDRRLNTLVELSDSKFVTFRTLLDSESEKVALALEASDKAVKAAFDASKEAITEAKAFSDKQFDLQTKQIDELRTSAAAGGGRSVGSEKAWGWIVAAVSFIVAMIVIMNNLTGAG